MSSYEGLAASYDALTTDVGYEKRADFLEKLFRRSRPYGAGSGLRHRHHDVAADRPGL